MPPLVAPVWARENPFHMLAELIKHHQAGECRRASGPCPQKGDPALAKPIPCKQLTAGLLHNTRWEQNGLESSGKTCWGKREDKKRQNKEEKKRWTTKGFHCFVLLRVDQSLTAVQLLLSHPMGGQAGPRAVQRHDFQFLSNLLIAGSQIAYQ